uniref:PROTEIN complex, DNA ejection, VIRAL.33A n=1 Tax=Podoviridae sp. ctP1X6 TaxID=2825246 RepID=A0A8S5U401_9CAUD|nr:MAG TPA: PROTEIN complex, DNA ejection, VIRAL.33A [Podoviridae sp. ctP1X6]
MFTTNNIFNYGETGERLGGIRDTEIYQQSAQRIENFVINEMGNLKIAKKLKEYAVNGLPINIEHIFDTKHNFYITVGNETVVTIKKDFENNNSPLLYQHNIGNFSNISYADEKLFVIDNTGNVKVLEFNQDGNIGASNFMNLLKFPVQEKQELTIDLYKIYQIGNDLRVTLIGTYNSPSLSVRSGRIFLSSSTLQIERLYLQYRTFSNINDIAGAHVNMVVGVLHRYFPETNGNYIIGNTPVKLGSSDSITSIQSLSGSGDVQGGEFSYGKIINFNSGIVDVGIYRDRLYFIKENTFYFSEISNYFNFRNGIRQSDPFFFKPTPINNVFPKVIKAETGNKIYVATNKGVYVISAYQTFSSTSYSVFVASEIPCREAGVLIKDDFYYISTENSLKCVQMIPNAQGYESYSVVDVEKYDIYTECEKIEKLKYDDRLMLVATKKKKGSNEIIFNKLCLYQALEFNLFRRFTINIDFSIEKGKLLSLDKYLVKDKSFFRECDNNVAKAFLRMNTPAITTKIGGRYGNDYSSQVERVFVKVLNQDQEAIKTVKIAGTSIEKFPGEDDLFSVFRLDKSFPILNGYDIEVITKENDKIFEILGIDTSISTNGD